MVHKTLEKTKLSMNALTKSQGLPLSSSTKDEIGDKSGNSGILSLSGINLDFRKSRDGLRSFF